MTKPTLLLIISFFIFRFSTAQYTPEKITNKMLEVEEYILSNDFNEALIVLNDLREKGYENANIDFKTGLCYLNTLSEKSKALPLLKSATQHISKKYNHDNLLETEAPNEALLLLGDAYRVSNKFSEAIQAYNQYSLLTGTKDKSQKRIRECHIARLLQSKPIEIKWEILDQTINQGISNLNPVISADGNILVFTRKMKFYDAIYISRYVEGKWEEPSNITTQIGSDGEYYPTALSADGTRILLSTYNLLSGQDIYESTWTGNRWTKLKKLDEAVNTNFAEVSASYSPDGNTIFFGSNRENGFGGFDIYKSDRRADGSWSHAINLGSAINTVYDEKNPRLLNGGKILAFSSQGHLNMGGMDLFYIEYPVTAVSRAKNMGFPFNSVNDDISFSPVMNQNIAFLAKHTEVGAGETDLVKADYKTFSSLFEVPVKASITFENAPDNDSINLFLVDSNVNDTIYQLIENANQTSVLYTLYPGKYFVVGKTAARQSEKAEFNISENVKNGVLPVSLSILFKNEANIGNAAFAATKQDSLFLKNISFEFNSHNLQQNFYPMLDKIAVIMSGNTVVNLIITGYADNLGKEEYNKSLSGKRALAVVHYLRKRGVDDKRMKTISAGSSNFIALNTNSDGSDCPEGRRYNRRVEIKIVYLPDNTKIINHDQVPEKLKIN